MRCIRDVLYVQNQDDWSYASLVCGHTVQIPTHVAWRSHGPKTGIRMVRTVNCPQCTKNTMTSPLEQLVDQACKHCPPKFRPTAKDRDDASDVAQQVIHHIDTMYPAMWKGAPQTARTSIRNTVYSRVIALIGARGGQK